MLFLWHPLDITYLLQSFGRLKSLAYVSYFQTSIFLHVDMSYSAESVENNVDPNQTSNSGSILFAQDYLFQYLSVIIVVCVSIGRCINTWPATSGKIRTCALSEDSDQPARMRRLIWIFTGRIFDSHGCNLSSCGQQWRWSDCADAQAGLSLRWVHMSEGTFSHVAAYKPRSAIS